MKISGTLPAVARRQESWMSNLEVIGIAQNYLHGETSGLNHASKMTTLLLSGNYLSCNGAGLEQSLDLGEGRFQAPQIQALLRIGAIAGTKQTVSLYTPFNYTTKRITPVRLLKHTSVQNTLNYLKGTGYYKNAVLMYPATSLTTSASRLPLRPATNSLTKDNVRHGQHSLFSGNIVTICDVILFVSIATGDASFYQFVYITLPLMIIVHICAILLATVCMRDHPSMVSYL